MRTRRKMTIVVAGDEAIEWKLVRGSGRASGRAFAIPVSRGTWRQADLMGLVAERAGRGSPPAVHIQVEPTQSGSDGPSATRINGSIKLPLARGDGREFWRSGSFLELKPGASPRFEHSAARGGPLHADVLLLDRAGRVPDNKFNRVWPLPVSVTDRTWVLCKTTRPLSDGNLWTALADRAPRVISLVSIDGLRDGGPPISRGLSWEQTCEDLARALRYHPQFHRLARCACTIVGIANAGAFLYDARTAGSPRCSLVFDPARMEADDPEPRSENSAEAFSILAATVALELARNLESPDLLRGIRMGLGMARRMVDKGIEAGMPTSLIPRNLVPDRAAETDPFRSVKVFAPWDDQFHQGWTFLESETLENTGVLARRIVTEGLGALPKNVPVATYGKLTTVDRSEIEDYNAVRNLVHEYLASKRTKPLSIAVFGPPGSGKSFGVQQIAESLSPDRMVKLEFNLSQFGGPEDLLPPFHKVRDEVLGGKCPLVFWDEFDASHGGERLFWLRYFLMPMQDGTFREGQLIHPLGKCIFVFAGGSRNAFGDFEMAARNKRESKGPDFLSRLQGHIDVLGPNPRSKKKDTGGPNDRFVPLRRAILLRSILERNAPALAKEGQPIDIDDVVLDVFLDISRYKHGTRSMESIVAMSGLNDHARFVASSLPPAEQIKGHVDANDFVGIVQRLRWGDEMIERLAQIVHEIYRHNAPPSVNDVPFDKLRREYQDSCRSHARFVKDQLTAAGFALVPLQGPAKSPDLPPGLVEKLAEREHGRWLRERRKGNWKLGYPKKEPPACVSPYLVPWDELPYHIQGNDRNFTLHLPETLAEIGYAIRAERDLAGPIAGSPRAVRFSVAGPAKVADDDATWARVVVELVPFRSDGASDDLRPVELVSTLAKGAERTLARRAIDDLDATLRVPLPMAITRYRKTFTTAKSWRDVDELRRRARQSFTLPPTETVRDAWRQARDFIVDDCEVLIVLAEKGKPDTKDVAATVARATERARHVVRIEVVIPMESASDVLEVSRR